MAEPVVERTIEVTRALRKVASQIMERAFAARAAGTLSLDAFFGVAERYQQSVNQANTALYEVVARLPKLDGELKKIEEATKQLEAASELLTKATDLLTVSGKLLLALTALVTVVMKPDGVSVSAATTSILDAARTIRDQVRR